MKKIIKVLTNRNCNHLCHCKSCNTWIVFLRNLSNDKEMKKIFSFVFGLLLFFCPLTVQADDEELMLQEEIAEAPSPNSMSEEAITYLLGEDIYQGTLSWQGNKASIKFNYDKKKKNR